MKHLIKYISIMIAFMSCTHKELCYDHSHIAELNVSFDWTNLPGAEPESMSLYLFSEDGNNPQRYELLGHEGATIKVSKGIYHALFLNSDTRNIECRDRNHISTFLVTSKDEDPISTYASFGADLLDSSIDEIHQNERVARQPEMLWAGCYHDIVVGDGENNITLNPVQSVIGVTINIHNVHNLGNISSIRGTISGFAEGVLLESGMRNECSVTHSLDIQIYEDLTMLYAELYTFGDCLSGSGNHYVDLYVTLKDATQWKYSYDVTSQVHEATDNLHINIVLENLPVPELSPGEGGGGVLPYVGEWKTVEIGLMM